MSFVIAAPELLESAAHDLAGIGSSLGEATGLAAAPTTSIVAAGADEVSVAIAALFGNHGQEFQALSAQAAAFHEEFVGLMKSGAGAYLSTEVANAERMLGSAVAAPAQALGGVTQKGRRRRDRTGEWRRCFAAGGSDGDWRASHFTVHHGFTD
ncbi:PE family protein [Mycobacterium sp.]|uniref:PE family protein n=1 Tax=Mycobacterium sp. TaxID=1785 RepID=UPI003F9AEAF1